jgi:hypothetical protein
MGGPIVSPTSQEVFGTVRGDGTLELDEKLTLPPGRVRLRVDLLQPATQTGEGLVEFGERMRRAMEEAGHKFRTKEEIDAEINEMRDEWDR